jgi:hypothetical protein
VDIPIKHLFVEYRHWIERDRPFKTVEDELATLSTQGKHFRRVLVPEKGDVVFGLATFMERFDIRTGYPLLLFLLEAQMSDLDWARVSTSLESYLLRRAVLGWPTKAYNRIFLNLVRALRKGGCGPLPEALVKFLGELTGESSAWPGEEEFSNAWQSRAAYANLNNARLNHILRRLNDTYLTNKNERLAIESELTVEHLLPQSWIEHWPLPDGTRGLDWQGLIDTPADDPRVTATRTRLGALETFGNLTVLTQALNSAVSNGPWSEKRPELLKASLLPINQQLHNYAEWNEAMIETRGRELLGRALKIWPSPLSYQPA